MKQTLKLFQKSLKQTPKQLWRNKFLSITTLVLGVLVLFWLNVVFSLQFFTEYTLQNLEKRADFMIPLVENYDSFILESLDNEIKNNYEVQIRVVSAQNLANFTLPSQYHIKFQHLEDVDPVFQILKKLRYTELIKEWDSTAEREFTDLVNKILAVRKTVKVLTYWFVGLFILGGIFLMINTFQLAIFNRRDEIFIAKMVGAKKSFITAPFICEGAVLGMIASVIAILGFVILLTQIRSLPGGAIFRHLWNDIFLWQLLLTSFIGGFGAYYAVQKHLYAKA
jgi:cell division transport system permease protein